MDELIRLAYAGERAGKHPAEATRLLIDGLFTTLTNVNFDDDALRAFTQRVIRAQEALGDEAFPVVPLFSGDPNVVSLRSTLLFGLKGMAAYAHHCLSLDPARSRTWTPSLGEDKVPAAPTEFFILHCVFQQNPV